MVAVGPHENLNRDLRHVPKPDRAIKPKRTSTGQFCYLSPAMNPATNITPASFVDPETGFVAYDPVQAEAAQRLAAVHAALLARPPRAATSGPSLLGRIRSRFGGVAPEIWYFSTRDPELAKQLSANVGRQIRLHYSEHRGVPTACFAETPYFADSFTLVQGELR